jgi:hypothetical protein
MMRGSQKRLPSGGLIGKINETECDHADVEQGAPQFRMFGRSLIGKAGSDRLLLAGR